MLYYVYTKMYTGDFKDGFYSNWGKSNIQKKIE